MKITSQKHLFSLDEGVTYLNCAYMSPLLKSVEQAGIEAIQTKRSPNNVKAHDFFENGGKLRSAFAKLINCPNPDQTAIIPSVSYGIATAANNIPLQKGDEIILTDEQFPSNYYAWEFVAKKYGATINTIAPEAGKDRGKKWNEKILSAINKKTKVVSMANLHWADGTLFDLQAIRKATYDVGAFLIIDGTQSVGALPFDVQEVKPDALICAAYKWLLGPYSIGMAYFSEAFQHGEPIEQSWINRLGSEDFAGLVNYESRYMPGNLRYQVGENSNFILVPMLLEALNQINTWTPGGVQAYCTQISKDAIRILSEKGLQIENEEYRAAHLFGMRVLEGDIELIKSRLEENNIYISVRGNFLRVSPHVYNTEKDFELLVECLTSVL